MAYQAYIRQAVENGATIFKDFVLTDAEKDLLAKEKRDVESIEHLKRVMSPYFFAGQYLNDPLDDSLVEFKREWIIRFERTPELMKVLSDCPAVICIDPAFRQKQTNDFTGLTVTKIGPDGLIYVLEARQLKVNASQLVDEIFKYVEIYKPRKVMVETVSAQIMLLDLLRNKMKERNKFFTIEEVQPNTTETKAIRIRGLIPYYANGRILHAPGLSDLEAQLLEFPRGIHDDIIDALAYHQQDWKTSRQQTTRVSEKTGTWNWWLKQKPMGASRTGNMKQLFGDLLS